MKLYKILTYIRLLVARCVHKAREKSPIVQLVMVPCVFCFVVVCYSFVGRICGKKEQAGVNPLKDGPFTPVCVITFQQSFPFFIRSFIPDTDTRAHTFRSITSKPYYIESCITAVQLEKTRPVLNETNVCAHTCLSRGNGCR